MPHSSASPKTRTLSTRAAMMSRTPRAMATQIHRAQALFRTLTPLRYTTIQHFPTGAYLGRREHRYLLRRVNAPMGAALKHLLASRDATNALRFFHRGFAHASSPLVPLAARIGIRLKPPSRALLDRRPLVLTLMTQAKLQARMPTTSVPQPWQLPRPPQIWQPPRHGTGSVTHRQTQTKMMMIQQCHRHRHRHCPSKGLHHIRNATYAMVSSSTSTARTLWHAIILRVVVGRFTSILVLWPALPTLVSTAATHVASRSPKLTSTYHRLKYPRHPNRRYLCYHCPYLLAMYAKA